MSTALKVGDLVTYADINLFLGRYYGKIVAVGPGRNGADCRVQWTSPTACLSDECLSNLRALRIDNATQLAA